MAEVAESGAEGKAGSEEQIAAAIRLDVLQ
jgi:hypothetical protein